MKFRIQPDLLSSKAFNELRDYCEAEESDEKIRLILPFFVTQYRKWSTVRLLISISIDLFREIYLGFGSTRTRRMSINVRFDRNANEKEFNAALENNFTELVDGSMRFLCAGSFKSKISLQ